MPVLISVGVTHCKDLLHVSSELSVACSLHQCLIELMEWLNWCHSSAVYLSVVSCIGIGWRRVLMRVLTMCNVPVLPKLHTFEVPLFEQDISDFMCKKRRNLVLVLHTRLRYYSNRSEKPHNFKKVCGKLCAACAVNSQVVYLLCYKELEYFVIFCALISVHLPSLFRLAI